MSSIKYKTVCLICDAPASMSKQVNSCTVIDEPELKYGLCTSCSKLINESIANERENPIRTLLSDLGFITIKGDTFHV